MNNNKGNTCNICSDVNVCVHVTLGQSKLRRHSINERFARKELMSPHKVNRKHVIIFSVNSGIIIEH